MSDLEDKVNEIVSKEIIQGRFTGTHKVKEIKSRNRFKAHINLATDEMFIGYDPRYIDEEGMKKFEETITDIPRHEIDHEKYEGFMGCPRNAELHMECFMEPMSKVLFPQGFNMKDVHYLSNALQDTILHKDLSKEFSLDGITNFFEAVGKSRKEKKFTSFYDAHVKLNHFLWGNKKQKRQLKRYQISDAQVKEVLENFLKKTGIKHMTKIVKNDLSKTGGSTVYDHARIRDYLNDETKWKDISKIYAEEFSKLMKPGYAMPMSDNSGEGTKGYDSDQGQEPQGGQSGEDEDSESSGSQQGEEGSGEQEGEDQSSGSGKDGDDQDGQGDEDKDDKSSGGSGSQDDDNDKDGDQDGSGSGDQEDDGDQGGDQEDGDDQGSGSGQGDQDDSDDEDSGSSSDPSQSDGDGMDDAGPLNPVFMPEEGNKFDKEIYTPDFKNRVIRAAYRNNKKLPSLFSQFESLDLLYQMLARELKVNAETFSQQSKFPIYRYGKRPFDPQKDNLKHVKFGLNDKGKLELQKKKYHEDMPLEYKLSPKGFPNARFGMIDSSGSMGEAIDHTGKGKTSIIPWGDNTKYHYALLAWYGFLEYLKQNHLLRQTSVSVANFSDNTYVGKGLMQAKRTALNPQWGGTHLDLDKIKEFFKYRDMIIFTMSDGELGNWSSIKDEFIKNAKKHHYFHLQIGGTSRMAKDLEEAGLKVVPIANAKDLASTVIDLTDKLYRGRE